MVSRAGFSLAEVIVAMTLLSIGTLGVAATGLLAALSFTRAEMRERALHDAESVLDSLTSLRSNGPGARHAHGAHITWAAGDSLSQVIVRITWPDRAPVQLVGSR